MPESSTTTPTQGDTDNGVALGDVATLVDEVHALRTELAGMRVAIDTQGEQLAEVRALAITLARQVQSWDEVLATLAGGSVGKALALVTRRKSTDRG